jgi:hypothetical protein
MQIGSYICGLKSSTIAVSVSYPVHTIDQYSLVFFLRYVWACEYFYCNCGCDCSCEFFECVHRISVHSTFMFLVILTRFSFFFFSLFSSLFSSLLFIFHISHPFYFLLSRTVSKTMAVRQTCVKLSYTVTGPTSRYLRLPLAPPDFLHRSSR